MIKRPQPSAAPASGADRLASSERLLAEVPAAFRTEVFDPRDPAMTAVFMTGSRTTGFATSGLPLPMQREISWWLATCDHTGERLVHGSEWSRWSTTARDVTGRRPVVCSFADLSLEEWMTAWGRVFHAEHQRMPAPRSRSRAEIALSGMLRRLVLAYSDAPWWRHDVWSLKLDARIPRREHEPRANTAVRWGSLEPDWLREATKYYLRLQLESGRMTWSTVMQHHVVVARFAAFLRERGIEHPVLATETSGLRAVALDFATFLHGWTRDRAGRAERGGSLTPLTIARNQQAIGLFYRAMADYRAEAATALGDERWLSLGDAHARLYRPEDYQRGRTIRQADEHNFITDTDLSSMLTHIEILGLPPKQSRTVVRHGHAVDVGGFGQPAVMRAWLIQALTGRRAGEVLMMDFEPLLAIPGLDPDTVPEGGMVAKLRYQQTKIDTAPNTILVGRDVVEIVHEQQAWVREHWKLRPDESIRYLFPKITGNRHGTTSWETSNYNKILKQFSGHLDLRDAQGGLLAYSRSHRLRHTKATTLLNAGAPIHVVQRYLGHLSPEMTMRYAATLAGTAEREFLALAKIGRDGRPVGMDRHDMLDLLQLDRRTDRVLPNGFCLLPPTRSCDKGNACHGCDHFATDRTHLPEIRRQLAETERLVEHRQAQHAARYGEPMSENNVWLEQRQAEIRSMRLEIATLEAQPDQDTSAVRGAGVLGRSGYQPGPVPITMTTKPTSP